MKSAMLGVLVFTVLSSSTAARLRRAQPSSAPLAANANPLLEAVNLPRFADISIEKHARPAVEQALEEGRESLKRIESELNTRLKQGAADPFTFNAVVVPLQKLGEDVGRPWGLLQHLQSVKENPDLRRAIAELEPKVVSFMQELGMSRPIYDAFVQLQNSSGFKDLSEAKQRIIKNEVRDRKLSGVGLSSEEAKEFTTISQELSKLSTDFGTHVLDSTAAWNLTLDKHEQVRGIPARALEMAAAKAREGGFPNATGENGPWVLGLDAPLFGPVMTYAEDRSLREQLFWAMSKRASTGSTDNTPIISSILEKRQRSAELLGYPNYAEMSFATKMANDKEVHHLLDNLRGASSSWAIKDLEELKNFAKKTDDLESLKHWDKGFYIEKLKKKKFNYDSEALREYFSIPIVLQGLFSLSHRLFGTIVVEVPAAEVNRAVWDKDVRLFKISKGQDLAGYVFFDTYSRPGQKSGGAWVQPLISRKSENGTITRYPVAVVVCNFPHPQGNQTSLLAFGEVETLFHEFGHALQHVLTTQEDTAVAGLNGVEWDAVEIASQFMEYWVTDDRATLYTFAKHHETGTALPESIYKNLKDSMHFRAASTILGQVYMGSIDLRLHEKFEKGEDVFAIDHELASSILPEPPLKEDRFLCSFQHIFSGGYSAAYYSYQWSNVLSADAFSAFEDNGGLSNETQVQLTGRRFADTVLALGGGRAPALVFKDFRGRQPSTSALLKYSGLPVVVQDSQLFF